MGAAEDLQSSRAIGRYLIYGAIASGGMATVHLGRLSGPAGFSRTVAIKRLHPQFARDPEFVAAFLDEARLTTRVRHPNVVSTLEVVATSGEIYLVMEYVEGETLARLVRATLARGDRVDPRVLATIMSGVLHGLHAAHAAVDERGEPLGIIHRDVSPQNIVVGVDGVARVLDFGVAKAASRLQTTRAGEIKGKLAYMPPERFMGSTLTPQADVYAAAVVMWESSTGQRLFKREGDNDAAIIAAVMDGAVAPPSEIAADVPVAFDGITLKGLARDLNLRYSTALEMALELESRVGIVSPFEVGQWVQKVAAEQLAERAERVKAIESASERGTTLEELMRAVQEERTSSPPLAAVPLPASLVPRDGDGTVRIDMGAHLSTSALATDLHAPPRTTAKAWSVFGIGAVAVVVLALVFAVGLGRSRSAEPSSAVEESDGGTAAPAAREPGPPQEAPQAEAADARSSTVPAASTGKAPRSRANPPAAGVTSRRPAPSPAGSATPNCVASFDDKGRKHWNCP